MMTFPGFSDSIDLADLLPSEVQGWKAEEPDGRYDFDTLYDYINGGAELYRSFNVRAVLARRYEKQGAQPILADVFDMGSSKDAFGAYHHDLREGEEVGIGQQSELLGSSLTFWKDRFYVSIIPFGVGEPIKHAVLELGRAIAQAIPKEGPQPDLFNYLPQEKRLPQVHYFHNHACLNTYYFLASENLLNLGQDTEGVLARYAEEHSEEKESNSLPTILVLVRYPSAEKAKAACEQFCQAYLPDADERGMARAENGRWAGAQLVEQGQDKLLVAVFDGLSREKALALVRAVGDLAKKNKGGTGK